MDTNTMKSKILSALALTALSLGAARAADYEIDPVGSYVVFNVSHFGVGACYGRFNEFSGTVSYDKDKPADAKLTFTVKAASIDTGNEKRDDHLRNADFFDVVKFPEIKFVSKSVSGNKLTGDLTMHGVTKEITADVTVTGIGTHLGNKKELLGAVANFTVKRTDFGMKYGVPDAVGDEVKLTVAIEALKK